MRGIVLPVVADVINVVGAVDVDTVVAPTAAATPVVAPAPDRPARAERETGRDDTGADIGWIAEIVRRVIRVRPLAIDGRGLVIGNIHRVGLRLFDDDHVPVVLFLDADLLLFVGDELVVRLCLGA